MEDFKAMVQIAVDVMRFEFTIWGFTLNFWDILIWSMIAGLLIWALVRFFE